MFSDHYAPSKQLVLRWSDSTYRTKESMRHGTLARRSNPITPLRFCRSNKTSVSTVTLE